jgi:FKBP-type peptidyl-prolyl cis-trans isomerase
LRLGTATVLLYTNGINFIKTQKNMEFLMSLNTKMFLKTLALSSAGFVLMSCSEQASENEATAEDTMAQMTEEAEQVMSDTSSFLEENKSKPGIEVTGSGLQYKVLLEGTGKRPMATDRVTVHYEGTLTDGTVFDSSYQRGQPIDFGLNQVIRGWTEGVQLMQEGAKYKFFIPSELAYGPRGTPGGPIGPNEDLIFTVELIRVN